MILITVKIITLYNASFFIYHPYNVNNNGGNYITSNDMTERERKNKNNNTIIVKMKAELLKIKYFIYFYIKSYQKEKRT